MKLRVAKKITSYVLRFRAWAWQDGRPTILIASRAPRYRGDTQDRAWHIVRRRAPWVIDPTTLPFKPRPPA